MASIELVPLDGENILVVLGTVVSEGDGSTVGVKCVLKIVVLW